MQDLSARHGKSELAMDLTPGERDLPTHVRVVRAAVEKANDAVFHVSKTQPQCEGMGTTIVAGMFYDNKVTFAHIGDSRVYRFRRKTLEQVTKDHSFVQELIDKGLYTKEEARASDKKNVVTRALGVAPLVEVECHQYEVEVGDIYLMCSDGLTDLVTDKDIERAFVELHANLKELCGYLVQLANANGGKDNISVILTRVNKQYPESGDVGWWQKIVNWFE